MPEYRQLKIGYTHRALRLACAVGFALLMGVACQSGEEQPPERSTAAEADPQACVPQCEGRVCGTDGCGGLCGRCDGEQICDGGVCRDQEVTTPETPAETCTATCADRGFSCGEVCGESCGACEDGEQCQDGRCVCQPDCNGRVCGESDGCGGTCSPCPSDFNCEDCPLRLAVASTDDVDGRPQAVTLLLEYNPGADVRGPVMADLRLEVKGPAELEAVGLGEPLVSADKVLMSDPMTQQPYQVSGDIYRFMVVSTTNANTIEGGRWLVMRFLIGDTASEGPVSFKLLKRSGMLAPPAADAALWDAELEQPVVVWPEVRRGE